MSSGFTLRKLQTLLGEIEEKGGTRGSASSPISREHNAVQQSAERVYKAWNRPISADLYHCPLSQPPSTLVQWDSLPRAVQEHLQDRKPAKEKSPVVEVPLHLLAAPELEYSDGQQPQNRTASSPQRRPLEGNLTNKLTEYTRGATGRCRPFRPGGIDDVEQQKQQNVFEEFDDEFFSQEAIERSQRVLEQGSKRSWIDGTLLTAPPGAVFQIGLSYKDVYGVAPDVEEKASNEEETVAREGQKGANNARDAQTSFVPAITWDSNFLDDDSLFGSSSDGDSESDAGDATASDEDQANPDGKSASQEVEVPESGTADEDNGGLVKIGTTGENANIGTEDVDLLLAELARAEAQSKKQVVVPKVEQPNNPLRLAERQAQLQNDTTRKSWATTNLLKIDDFNSVMPNPAISFPFTLDPFQQQAVVRLERSESVFVAAHTSAGKTVVAEYACALAKQRATRCIYTSPIKALSNQVSPIATNWILASSLPHKRMPCSEELQKFRDFCSKFGSENVGLVTGDLQLNVDDSTCLIMTTEILRSMLYRGADLIRDIEWVVFDEVHYVNDSERGVVWEEVIIMLPAYVNLIFLSATTPNTLEFSDWIGRTKRKPVHVIKTDYRPVPLSHYLWAGLKLHKVMEGKSGFLDKGYREAAKSLQPTSKEMKAVAPTKRGGPKHLAWQAQGNKQNWMSLVRFLEREELTPTVVFSFSKKKCEEIADMLRSLDLNTANEKSTVQGFTMQTVARLSPNDAVLPQVLTICEMVKRGIGVHHGGLLPILKEMVEILFSRNLIKVLFATETFAIGVNMPARAVVFNSIRKHDGIQFRVLEPGEYTQMAGRAGRRGLDKVGTVIMCCFGDEPPPMPILRNMLTGSSTMLRSQFRLTYNMILNLLRVEEMSVESMIKRSFSEFATQRALAANEYPKLLARGKKTLAKLEEKFKLEASQRVGADDLEEYFSTCSTLLSTNRDLLAFILDNVVDSGDSPLQPGRIILVSAARQYNIVHSPALVLHPPASPGVSDRSSYYKRLVCMVLLPEGYVPQQGVSGGDGTNRPVAKFAGSIGYIGLSDSRHYALYEIPLDGILVVTTKKLKIDHTLLYKKKTGQLSSQLRGAGHITLGSLNSRQTSAAFDNPFAGMKSLRKDQGDGSDTGKGKSGASATAQAIEKAVKNLINAEHEEATAGLSTADLREYVRHGSDVVDFRKRCTIGQELTDEMRKYSSHTHPSIGKHFSILDRKRTLHERVDALQHLLSNESLNLFPDFLQRKAVLRTLGYLDESETVCVKGRVACEVNTCEELIVTEMVFEGIMNELEPAEIVAALSALVYQQKGDEQFDMEIPRTLLSCCARMKTIAMNLGQLQKEHGLEVDPAEYCDGTLKFGLVHVVYEWALGVPFRDICDLTTAQEGSIVRCITRLDELCREVRNCARVVGNPTLYRKMEAASMAIKRDIVFASSLYVS